MSRLGHINRVKHCFDNRTLILIINALGFSNFITLLSPQSGLIRRNLTLPNSKLSRTLPERLLAGPRYTTMQLPFSEATGKWLPVKQHLYHRDSIMAFKCMICLVPAYLSDQFIKRSSIYHPAELETLSC